jgi:chromosomal replication initiator protein
VWQVVPDELELQMTKDAFDTWLADAQAEGIDGDTLIVGVPSVYAKDWLEGRLGTVVARTVHSVTEHIESVRFVLAGETGSGA